VFQIQMVHGTNGLHMVRIVCGTNSQWYEKPRHRPTVANEELAKAFYGLQQVLSINQSRIFELPN